MTLHFINVFVCQTFTSPNFFPKTFFLFFKLLFFVIVIYPFIHKTQKICFLGRIPNGNSQYIIPYISISIRLPHLCQGDNDHCVVTTYDRWMGRLESGSLMLVFGWGNGGVGIRVFLIFVLLLCSS